MSTTNKPPNFVYSSFQKVKTPTLVILLLGVEALLKMKFKCPGQYNAAIVYGIVFLVLPVVILFIFSLMLRPRRSSGLFSPKCCSFKYFLDVIGQVGKAPFVWFLIVLIDGEYLTCFARTLAGRRAYVLDQMQFLPMCQVSGLLCLALLIILEYCVPQFTCAKKYLSYWYRKQQEDLVLREVEIVLQEKAAEKRRIFIENMISLDLDKLSLEKTCTQEIMLDLEWKYKDNVQKIFTEIKESSEVHVEMQEA
ncbi:uncharacterized protein LOC142099869 [Mixophyes fleayi]|uniref:uncharacterized protein LOC142099869 n=1 Tax=Mixophyes fleayi TaxID=3061075 RepID=UPI003F4DDF4D